MEGHLFGKQPILLPKECDLSKWAVIACDQYTTNKKYWQDLYDYIGDAPSTLHLIFPEIFLKEENIQPRIDKINLAMREYTKNGFFKEIPGMILVERTLPSGKKRLGLVMSVDLEAYEYRKVNVPIRATEATILERLPVRMHIKENASIELPHILLLYDDKKKEIIEPLYEERNKLPKLYDFTLNQNGGKVCGYQVADTKEIEKKFLALLDKNTQIEKYGEDAGMLFAVGDGNHSMASAKEHWNNLKKGLTPAERENHPARYILVEVVNLYQDSMDFEPINRVVMNTNPDAFIKALSEKLSGPKKLTLVIKGKETLIPCPEDNAMTIKTVQEFLMEYKKTNGIVIDYEHSGEQVRLLSENDNTVGILLPTFDKSTLFNYVVHNGNLPQKAFSIGTEDTKKYYIESKRIK
ncbi:MAG: DUF1015 domain-containing protein [Clostridia bacterium]|nr:DUF1015 domain-containing protein [Clostridia bacterium]